MRLSKEERALYGNREDLALTLPKTSAHRSIEETLAPQATSFSNAYNK